MWALLGSIGSGCVVYRDRVITVSTRTRVELGGTPAAVRPQASTGWAAEGPRALQSISLGALLDFGQWREHDAYGRVWVPDAERVGEDFVPYLSRGHWELTGQGWYWQSQDTWGSLTFHYGRWVLIERTWAWVPGRTFAPAWVDWRVGAGWVGWSPRPPEGASFAAPYVYCSARALPGAGIFGRAILGPAAASLYYRTHEVAETPGYGGVRYAWGPSPGVVGVATNTARPVAQVWAASPRLGIPSEGAGTGPVGQPVQAPLASRVRPSDDIPEVPSVARLYNPATGTLRALDSVPGALREVDDAAPVAVGPPRETVTLGSRVEVPMGGGSTGYLSPEAVRSSQVAPEPRRVTWGASMRPEPYPVAQMGQWVGRGGPEPGSYGGGSSMGSAPSPYVGPQMAPSYGGMPRFQGGYRPSTAGFIGAQAAMAPTAVMRPAYTPTSSVVGAYPVGAGYGMPRGGGMMPSAQPSYAPSAFAPSAGGMGAGQAVRPAMSAAPMGYSAPSAFSPVFAGPR